MCGAGPAIGYGGGTVTGYADGTVVEFGIGSAAFFTRFPLDAFRTAVPFETFGPGSADTFVGCSVSDNEDVSGIIINQLSIEQKSSKNLCETCENYRQWGRGAGTSVSLYKLLLLYLLHLFSQVVFQQWQLSHDCTKWENGGKQALFYRQFRLQ